MLITSVIGTYLPYPSFHFFLRRVTGRMSMSSRQYLAEQVENIDPALGVFGSGNEMIDKLVKAALIDS